jgi:hypothetical protein
LTNTGSVSAGTLQIYYWDELTSPATSALTADLVSSAIDFAWNGGPLQVGSLVQIENEIAEVDTVDAVTGAMTLIRGSHGTNPVTHVVGTTVYPLAMKTLIVPFSPGFFGSRASGSYTFPIFLPDARIAAANLFATNSRGNGETQRIAFTQNASGGLRTLSGGQLTLQYEGHLAIQADAGPPLVIESSHSVRDIFATVALAPSGGQVDVQVNVAGVSYCTLTIPDGATRSNVVDGFGLPPLTAMSDLRFDITAVPQGVGVAPGRDLTITIRL